ncbi:hypothetical protein [Mesobacillus jeotgali]|uniref:hypothetical protein n=1 Tax=Mesobacillus jeotgali TaxID=129985 RepID=UPI00158FAC52|nr:hypothetical protein [Mesobacillus jeotgali]
MPEKGLGEGKTKKAERLHSPRVLGTEMKGESMRIFYFISASILNNSTNYGIL